MNTSSRVGAVAAVAMLAGLLLGCSNQLPLPSGPGPTPPPAKVPVFPAPAATSLSPSVGTTSGGTIVQIAGTGFVQRPTVLVGDQAATGVFTMNNGTTVVFTAPARAAGAVDVVVTNPDGHTATLVNGYTYAPADSFDLNGAWRAGADPYQDYSLNLNVTIQNNELVSFSCGTSETILPSPRPAVSNGQFLFVRGDGVFISGEILADLQIHGAVNVGPCVATTWFGNEKTAASLRL